MHIMLCNPYFAFLISGTYSHLSNNRGGWNKRGGEAKLAKSLNVEAGINVEVGTIYEINKCGGGILMILFCGGENFSNY